MKKAILILTALTIAYSFSAPIYFTFTGKVNLVPSDVGGYAAAYGIHAGSPVTYIVVLDTAQNGYTRFDGTITDKPDINNEGYRANYFFDSLVAPSLFSPAVTDDASGSFFGYQTVTTLGASSRYSVAFQTLIGTPDTGTQIIIYVPDTSATVFLPKVGDVVTATESYNKGSAASSSVSMSLTLTAIGGTKPSNGVRSYVHMASTWMNAEVREGSLLLRNHSGKKAMVKVMDASGKAIFALSMGDKAAISLSSLPRGELFLEVTATGGEPVLQAFFN
jgi:hypothetical protein